MQITCASCHIAVLTDNSSIRYCDPCRVAVRRKNNREYEAAKRRKLGVAQVGSTASCVGCCAGFIKTSAAKTRCAACATQKESDDRLKSRLEEREKRPDLARARSRKYYASNRDTIAEKAAKRRVTETSKSYYRERARRLSVEDVNYALNKRVRLAVWRSLKGGKSGRSWKALLDYTVEDLAIHLERQFQKGMTWENMGRWHIDHILPLKSFDFSSPEDPAFRACWALTNLRPLWAADNHIKSGKVLFLL